MPNVPSRTTEKEMRKDVDEGGRRDHPSRLEEWNDRSPEAR